MALGHLQEVLVASAPIYVISDKSNLRVYVSGSEPILDSKGQYIGKTQPLVAQFIKGGAAGWAIEEAEKVFNFSGRSHDEPVSMMVGVFDSAVAKEANNWSDDQHDRVVAHFKKGNPYWRVVEAPKPEAPWPNYDELGPQGKRTTEIVAEKNLATAGEIGVSVNALIDYERATRNDAKIIAAYEAAISTEVVGELIEA